MFLGTNVRSGTARCLVVAHRAATRVRRHRQSPHAAAARNRVRSRHPPLRLPADERDADHGARGLRRARACTAGRPSRRCSSRRAGGRAQPRAAAGDPQRQPGARRADDGAPTACSCAASTPSRTSAAWTSCAPTRPARSPKASCSSKAPTTPHGAPSSDVLELAACNAALETGLDQPARRRDPRRRGGRISSGVRQARRDPVRLRPQARQRRRP